MAYNKSDRCSTCLGHCSVTVGHNPILLPCGHQSCSRCHQTQWLTSERNDSEEIDCIKCTLAALSEQSNERHDRLMSSPTLFGLANVGAVIRGAAGTHTEVHNAESTNPQLAGEDTCTSGACSKYPRQTHNHRNWSSPTDIIPTKTETGWNGKQSSQPSTLVTRKVESDNKPKDTALNNRSLSSVCEEVLRFTPLDSKKKHHKKSKKNKKETNQLLSTEKSSEDTTMHVTNKTESPNLMHPKHQVQTCHEKTHKNVSTRTHKTTHDQMWTCGQNVMEDHTTSDHSQPTSKPHRHHKHSHKKSKKKKKNKEKNRTESRQDTSLKETSSPECKTNIKVKDLESSPQMVHLIAREGYLENSGEDKLYNAENSEVDQLSSPGKNQADTLYTERKRERDNMSIVKNDERDILHSSGKSEVRTLLITGDSESDKLSIDREGNTLPVDEIDGSELEEVTLHSFSCVSLDACASSTRFSSPMSLDDYQLKNILEDKNITELEVQNWEDSDKDDTNPEVEKLKDLFSPDRDGCSPTFLCSSSPNQLFRKSEEFHKPNTGKSEFYQDSILGTCSETEPDIAVNQLAETKKDISETNTERLSLDGSILDRSGILYYDPIDDSDDDKLVIDSRVMSEASLTENQAAVPDSNTNETVSSLPDLNCDSRTAIKKEDLSSATHDSLHERDTHPVTTESDHEQLLQSYLQYLNEKSSNFINTNKEIDKQRQLQEKNLVKGFQESYATSLICSQLANKALNKIKETRDGQSGQYQLSAKMLTGVLNILVQQANLASTICSELLNSTEDMQAELLEISGATTTPDNIPGDVAEKVGNDQIRVGAEIDATINIALGDASGTSDLGNNSHSLNVTVASSSAYTEKILADDVQSGIEQEQTCSKIHNLTSTVLSSKPSLSKETSTCNATRNRSELNMATDITNLSNPESVTTFENGNQTNAFTKTSIFTDLSDKDKTSGDSLSSHSSNSDTEKYATGIVSKTTIKEAEVCIEKTDSAKIQDENKYQECSHKGSTKQMAQSYNRSFVHSKTLDSPSRHRGKGKKYTVDEKDVSRSDLTNSGRKDEVKVRVSSSQSTLSDLNPEDGIQQGDCGTQVTESDLEEAVGHKSDRHKGQTPDNVEQRTVKSNKHYTTDTNVIHSGRNIDKDRESQNRINNQPKPPNGKRNLFDSVLLEIEEGVVDSPCKYRKLQFGKLPQSHTEGGSHLDTSDKCDKVSIETAGTISLSKQKCKNEVKTKQGSDIRHKGETTPQSLSNKLVGNASGGVSSPKTIPETKVITTRSSTRRRSSSVPTYHHDSDSKDKIKSRSKYHSSCCSSCHSDSSSNHKNRGPDRKATPGSKRGIRTDLQNVHQTPGNSKKKLDINKGYTISLPSKATGDAVRNTRKGVSTQNEKCTVNCIKSKEKKKERKMI